MNRFSREHQALVPAQIHEAFDLAPPDTPGYRQAVASIRGGWRPADPEERDEYIRFVLDLIREPKLRRSDAENRDTWHRGWSDALADARQRSFAPDSLTPRYFRDSVWLRWAGGLLRTTNPQLEHDCFGVARHLLFSHFLRDASEIWEVGCGSGQNLRLLSDMFPGTPVRGLDFVEPAVDLANEMGRALGRPIVGTQFDMLNPTRDLRCPPGTAIVTIHAMEQLGERFQPLLDWLVAAGPAMVLHYEPVVEFYDDADLLDYVARWYCAHRNYLAGYWPALTTLADRGRIERLYHCRPYLGGVIHEASVIAWTPTPAGSASGGHER